MKFPQRCTCHDTFCECPHHFPRGGSGWWKATNTTFTEVITGARWRIWQSMTAEEAEAEGLDGSLL